MCSVILPALACLTAFLNFWFLLFLCFYTYWSRMLCWLCWWLFISQMSTAVTVSVRMEEPVRWAYSCFIWQVFLDIVGWISCTAFVHLISVKKPASYSLIIRNQVYLGTMYCIGVNTQCTEFVRICTVIWFT